MVCRNCDAILLGKIHKNRSHVALFFVDYGFSEEYEDSETSETQAQDSDSDSDHEAEMESRRQMLIALKKLGIDL